MAVLPALLGCHRDCTILEMTVFLRINREREVHGMQRENFDLHSYLRLPAVSKLNGGLLPIHTNDSLRDSEGDFRDPCFRICVFSKSIVLLHGGSRCEGAQKRRQIASNRHRLEI